MSKLIDVRDAHTFDLTALSTYLSNTIGSRPIESVRQYAGGQSNPTFLLLLDDGLKLVLRKKPPGKLLPSAHLIEREFQIMSALADAELPVPRMRHLATDESIIGTSFYVMDHLDGRVFVDTTLGEASNADRVQVYQQMVGGLATLHSLDYEALGLAEFGRPNNYLERQIKLWSKQYLAAKTDELAAMDFLLDWLPSNLPPAQATTIAHGDYRLGNLMFAADAPRLIAVLDWELATLGDPLSDLAYNCIAYDLPAGSSDLPGLGGVDLESLAIPDESSYVDQYCSQTGRPRIDNWHFYMAFAYFRLTSICQGVYARGIQGNASDRKALQYGEIAKWLAANGRRRATGG